MPDTLVYLEHHDGRVVRGSLGLLGQALAAGLDVAGVILGADGEAAVDDAGRHGAGVVYLCKDAALDSPLSQPRVDAIASLVQTTGAENVLFAGSVLSADVAAGLAAALEAGLNWGVTDFAVEDGELVATRPALGDTVIVHVGWKGTPRILLARAGAFEPVEQPVPVRVESFDAAIDESSQRARIVEQAHAEDSGVAIEDADIIVAGGRGLGGPEGFELCQGLAEMLGGAVGASRAAVDLGWYPFAAQIGQTGKSVAPTLYVALGISGAVQHKVGMHNSGTIVAVNTDASAPIFEFAHVCVVADVHTVVPELIELVQARRQA